MHTAALLVILAGIIHLASCAFLSGIPHTINARVAEGFSGAVASDEWRCSRIGRSVLQRGGTAVDAAVATALCLGVVNPVASGIGGGSFLLLRLADGEAKAFDMREVAPAAAYENMYAENPDSQITGALALAVPGEVAGLHLVWQQHGRLPWKSLFRPAIRLAEKGFVVRRYLASMINSSATAILADEGLSEVFAPNGTLLGAGDICFRTALARTLRSIAEEGPVAFYRGAVARNFVADVQAAGGILTMEDLAGYRVRIREPIVENVLGLTILGMPPPSSGGACMILVLNILACYKDPMRAVTSSIGLHRTIEAFKHAFAVRMNLGDPDFENVTDVVADMLNPAFAADLQKLIFDNGTFPPSFYGGKWNQLEDHGTSHFNVVDEDRNIVSMTTTVNYAFGAKILSRSTGIILNNEMGDFSVPISDVREEIPAVANFIRPHKRPLSSMSPTIVLKDGQFLGVLGGSGGVKIITTTTEVFLNQFWKGYSPLQSVVEPRLHHQLIPDLVDYEDWTTASGELVEVPAEVVELLRSKGHNMTATTGATSQLIVSMNDEDGAIAMKSDRPTRFRNGKLIAVSDLRKDGIPAAF